MGEVRRGDRVAGRPARPARTYFQVWSADCLEGVFLTRTHAEGYLFDLRRAGVPGLRIEESATVASAADLWTGGEQ